MTINPEDLEDRVEALEDYVAARKARARALKWIWGIIAAIVPVGAGIVAILSYLL